MAAPRSIAPSAYRRDALADAIKNKQTRPSSIGPCAVRSSAQSGERRRSAAKAFLQSMIDSCTVKDSRVVDFDDIGPPAQSCGSSDWGGSRCGTSSPKSASCWLEILPGDRDLPSYPMTESMKVGFFLGNEAFPAKVYNRRSVCRSAFWGKSGLKDACFSR
mmetsp:Transcript_18300/g.42916  ORF Transcript_18300/g.42916 Transcript_18300/m.42916 type:complete len:161 (-) Transcript_18300:70-552(-)|eukprot:s2427_g19.t2